MDMARTRIIAIIALLILYVTPIMLAATSGVAGHLTGDALPGRMLVALIVDPDSPPSLLQKLLLPLTAAVTVSALWATDRGRLALALIVITVAGLGATMATWFVLSDADALRNLWQTGFNDKVKAETFAEAKDQFLTATAGSLATYLAVLLGAQLKP